VTLGIRGRLVAAMVLVTVLASALVGIGLDRFTQHEFNQFLGVEEETTLPALDLDEVGRRLEADDAAGVVTALGTLAAGLDSARVLLFDRSGTLRGDTAPEGTVLRHEDGSLEVRIQRGSPGARRDEVFGIGGGLPVPGRSGPVGTLYVLPSPRAMTGPPPEVGFTRSVRRAHLVGVAVAALLGLGIALVLSGHMVGPLQHLTRAAQAVAGGNLSPRVDASGGDEIATLGRAFNSMAASLEEQESLRRRMVGDVAHELRTPLTHLRCRLESAQDGVVSVDDALLDGLHGEIVHLSHLVDDLQDLSLLEAGTFPLHPADVDLVDATRRTLQPLRSGHPGASIELEAPATLRAHVDADRFRQVLRNLVENALRHGPEAGRVRVRLSAGRCEVEDEGPGLPEEEARRVFDRFYRMDPSRSRASGGAGLGLAICRQLVRAWGGEIGVSSPETGGTRFWFTVP